MEEYHCYAYPQITVSNVIPEIPPNSDGEQEFNVKFERSNGCCKVLRYNFQKVPKEEIMDKTSILSWLTFMDVPSAAQSLVLEDVMQCAREMLDDPANTRKQVLHMCVDLTIIRENEDETNDSNDDTTTTEEDEDENDDINEENDEDYGLVPAAKTVIEGLKIVKENEKKRCAICFEDFVVGVRMACMHMFHKNCISEWLKIGHSCPLCRFQVPTTSSD
ncbi:unnamed protein product [Sphenostylis stenocarpa]|uniref:RING-type E3 ubiquitin transferase n=1 Tax=Sphenostylis stenocarpa TaxID=92480 RepID=A0AA86SYF2_9FABA|nr:unnamed protein product [Sphenostylis stenocarpa]